MTQRKITADTAGSVWEVAVELGGRVLAGDTLIVIESMKMEIPVVADEDGVVVEIRVAKGDPVAEGDWVATVRGD